MNFINKKPPPDGNSNDTDVDIILRPGGEILFVHDDGVFQLLNEVFPDLIVSRASLIEPGSDGFWRADFGPLKKIFDFDDHQIVKATRRDLAIQQEVDVVRSVLAYCKPRKDLSGCHANNSDGIAQSATTTAS